MSLLKLNQILGHFMFHAQDGYVLPVHIFLIKINVFQNIDCIDGFKFVRTTN